MEAIVYSISAVIVFGGGALFGVDFLLATVIGALAWQLYFRLRHNRLETIADVRRYWRN